MNNTTVKTPQELVMVLKSLRLSGMANELEKQLMDPNADLIPFIDRIREIIEAESNLRYDKKFARFLKLANLRYPDASFDDSVYDLDRQLDTKTIEALLDCRWIDEGRNLIITGKCGGGKTYLSNILAINALRQFKNVRYVKAERLIQILEKAEIEGKALETVDLYSKIDLLILDDFGLMNLDLNKCRNLFQVIDAREGRKSIIVVSQFPVSSWYSMFGNNTYADACLDRLVHDAYRLEFNGRNMRNPNL